MRVAGERVADEERVVARLVQLAVGLVGDAHLGQRSSAVERERLGQVEELRLDDQKSSEASLRRYCVVSGCS